LLAYVYQPGDEMFNEDLLDGGYAVSPNDEHKEEFEAAQEEARSAGLGIWGSPGASSASSPTGATA
jgi:micrococcal nuclease